MHDSLARRLRSHLELWLISKTNHSDQTHIWHTGRLWETSRPSGLKDRRSSVLDTAKIAMYTLPCAIQGEICHELGGIGTGQDAGCGVGTLAFPIARNAG